MLEGVLARICDRDQFYGGERARGRGFVSGMEGGMLRRRREIEGVIVD